ncbi:MAG: hypothetical protein LCH95_22155 [Proteobacteria bacterium]|nr:hypothetical protein [Pseudomonadota bacterium]
MMSRPVTLDVRAARLCEAVRALASDHEAWIPIDRLQARLQPEEVSALHAAIAFAAARNWLAISRAPADHVLLKPGAP